MNYKGFTLIELLVVVLIVGILSTVALPQYRKAVEKSHTAEAVTFVSAAKRAIAAYLLEYRVTAQTDMLTTPALNVDLTRGLDCSDGYGCYSKYYYYIIECWPGGQCNIETHRTKESGNAGSLHYKGGIVTFDGGQTWSLSGKSFDKIGQITCRALNELVDETSSCDIVE